MTDSIAHYRIVSKIGEGGMGAVYRATDTKLARDVAIKVLPDTFANDADRLARFTREAQVLASLNHPNIAAVYGIEERAIVMELVEGPTLADRIAQGAVGLEEALPIARQIAEALEAAHEKGIIHRDLKPANVKVTADGTVKVLDFGLAKLADAAEEDPGSAPTIVRGNSPTLAGMIMGTAGYMSPEQARGKRVDKRTDIWAFGVVLFEMLTGKELFGGGETVTDMLAAVVTRDPDWSLLPVGTPANIQRLLDRCLRKDLKTRLRDIGEARFVLEGPLEGPAVAQGPVAAAAAQRSWLMWGLLAMAVLGGGYGWWRATRPEPLRPLVRLSAEMELPIVRGGTGGGLLALSADGSRLAVTLRGADGRVRIHTRPLNQAQTSMLSGTEDANTLFFSPDGKWIGFSANGKLKKVSVEGGATITLCDATLVRGASWGDDGNIVYGLRGSSLWRISAAGGAAQPLTKVNNEERNHRWPQVLPGSEAILFTASETNNYDNAHIEVLSVKSGQRKVLLRGGHSGHYVATPGGSGRLLYLHDSTMFAVGFDLKRLEVTGTAAPVLEEVSSSLAGGGEFSVSETGTLVYLTGKQREETFRIVWLDGAGERPLESTPGMYFTPHLSGDGKRLAYSVGTRDGGADVWVKELERGTSSRLSFLQGQNVLPMWTPDGKSIIFRSSNWANPGLYWIRSDGAGEAQRLTDGKLEEFPSSISPDGKRLVYAQKGKGLGIWDVYTAAIEGAPGHPKLGRGELFVGTPFAEMNARFSPDGRWMAYHSTESGRPEIYVRPFPGPGGRWQISPEGANVTMWSSNGREVLYRQLDGQIMVVPYTTQGDTFNAGKPRAWSNVRLLPSFAPNWPTWDIAPDGKRLVALIREEKEEEKPPTQLSVLVHFADELQRRGEGEKAK